MNRVMCADKLGQLSPFDREEEGYAGDLAQSAHPARLWWRRHLYVMKAVKVTTRRDTNVLIS